MLEKTVKEKTGAKAMEDMTLDELDELEDEEEEKILEQMRRQRMAEIRDKQAKARFGDVREISAQDYVQVRYNLTYHSGCPNKTLAVLPSALVLFCFGRNSVATGQAQDVFTFQNCQHNRSQRAT